MQVTLTKELEQCVRTKLQSGRHADEREVVREALRAMEQREAYPAQTITPLASRLRPQFIAGQCK